MAPTLSGVGAGIETLQRPEPQSGSRCVPTPERGNYGIHFFAFFS